MVVSVLTVGCAAEPGEHEPTETDAASAPDLELVAPGYEEAPGAEATLMFEGDACTTIVQTYSLHGLDIGCPTTIKACPGLFRDSFGVACMQYHASSIASCVRAIEATATCDEIRATTCDVMPMWGSEPAGCDDPS